MRGGGSLDSLSKGAALMLFLFYVNVSGMRQRFRLFSQLLTISAPWIHWVTASRFLAGNMEAELKPRLSFTPTFLCFPVFPLLLTPQRYNTFECFEQTVSPSYER